MSAQPLIKALGAGGCFLSGLVLGALNADSLEAHTNFFRSWLQRESGKRGHAPLTASQLLSEACRSSNESGEFAVLSTINLKGGVSARLIQPYAIEPPVSRPGNREDRGEGQGEQEQEQEQEEVEIYFNTNLLSRKATEMQAEPKVALTYVDAKKLSCVSWHGSCQQVLPQSEAKKHWKEWLRVFYPEGPDGGRFSTWRLVPDRISVVAYSKNIQSDREDHRPPEIIKNANSGGWEWVKWDENVSTDDDSDHSC